MDDIKKASSDDATKIPVSVNSGGDEPKEPEEPKKQEVDDMKDVGVDNDDTVKAEEMVPDKPEDLTSDYKVDMGKPKKPSPNKLWMTIGAIVAVAILAVVGLTYFVLNDDDGNNGASETVKREIPLLRISVPESPLNTFYSDLDNDAATAVNAQIYEGLVAYEKVTQFAPKLATSWTNPDNETWVFTLKQGVKFHNGSEMTSADVKYSIDNGDAVGAGGFNATIAETVAVDDYTISISTDGPDPLLLGKLAFLWITDDANSDIAVLPAGTGPYVLDEASTASETDVKLVAFDDYHGGTVYTRQLNFMQMENTAAVEAFNDGLIDIASTLTTDSENLNLPTQKLLTVSSFNVNFLGINSTVEDSPLADLNVRKAIALTIDPAKIVEAQGVVGEPIGQLVTRDIPGYNPNLVRWERDTEEALSLMAEAGYEDGFTVSLSYASDDNDGMFDSVKQQLAEIGITVTKDAFGDNLGDFFGKILSAKTELFFVGWQPEVLDASDTFGNLFTSEGPIYQNPAVDAKLAEAATTIDDQARVALLQDVATILYDNVASVPLYIRDEVTALAGPYVAERDLPGVSTGFYYSKVYLP